MLQEDITRNLEDNIGRNKTNSDRNVPGINWNILKNTHIPNNNEKKQTLKVFVFRWRAGVC